MTSSVTKHQQIVDRLNATIEQERRYANEPYVQLLVDARDKIEELSRDSGHQRWSQWARKADHLANCGHWEPWTGKGCTCGLSELLSAMPDALEKRALEIGLSGDSHG